MLKLQHFGHLIQRANSLEKTLMLRKTDSRRRGRQRMRWLDGKLREAYRAAVHGVARNRTRLSNWTRGFKKTITVRKRQSKSLKQLGPREKKKPNTMNSLKVCYSRIWHAVQMQTFPLSLHHLLTSTPSPTASRPTASCPKKATEKPGQVMEEGLERM